MSWQLNVEMTSTRKKNCFYRYYDHWHVKLFCNSMFFFLLRNYAKERILKLPVVIGTHKPFTEVNTLAYDQLWKNAFYECDSFVIVKLFPQLKLREMLRAELYSFLLLRFSHHAENHEVTRNNTNASTNYVGSNFYDEISCSFSVVFLWFSLSIE